MQVTAQQQATLALIAAKLTTERAYNLGMSIEGSVATIGGSVHFKFPAPVVSGCCTAFVSVFADGKVLDSVSDVLHPNFEAWEAEFEETCKFGEE